MGGICSVVQGVLAVGFITQGIAQAVLKEKIKKLIKGHEDEFEVMNDLYGFVDKLLNQKNLVSQLNASVLFATDNWNTIFDDLQEKNDLLVKLLASFPDVKAADYKYTLTSGMVFGVSVLAFAYIAYDFVSGKTIVDVKADFGNIKSFCKTTSAKIRSLAPQIRGSHVNENGSDIQVSSVGTNASEIPASVRSSAISQVQIEEKTGGKSKVITGLRVIFIAVSIYYFVQGSIGLKQLTDQISKYQKYFKTNGDFQQGQEGVLQLMNFVGVDIFNLANCSRAAIYDSRNMLLVKSITLPRYHEKALDYAEQLNADSYGLTDDFIDKSKALLDSCNNVAASGKSIQNKLKDLKTAFQTFFDSMKPEEVFLKVSTELSSVVGKYSIIAESINDDQHNVNRFLTKVSEIFQDERRSDFNSLPAEKKQSIDQQILEETFDKYKSIFDLDSLTMENMDEETKDIIFQTIVSFASEFYADDLTGKSLFGLNIEETKSELSYKELLDSVDSKANIIPVSKENSQDEEKQVNSWLETAKNLNAQAGYKYWKQTDVPKSVFRYIRLEVDKYISKVDGSQMGTLVGYEGINLEVNSEFFNTEKNTLTNALTLYEA